MTGDHLGDHLYPQDKTTPETTTPTPPENPTSTGRDHLQDHPRPPIPGEGVEGGPCKGTTLTPHPRCPSQSLTPTQNLRYSTTMATRWSTEQRTHALDQLRNGHTPADVAETTGIPRRTLAHWAQAEGIEISSPLARAKTARAREVLQAVTAEKRADLAAGLMADAQRLRTQLFAPVVEKRAMAIAIGHDQGQDIEIAEVPLERPTPTDQVKIMTAVAIAVDKIQLLTGEATERHEHTAPARTPEQEQELAKVLTLVQGNAA